MLSKNEFISSHKDFLLQLPNEAIKKTIVKIFFLLPVGWLLAIFITGAGQIILQDYLRVPQQFLYSPIIILQDFSFILVTLVLFYRFNPSESINSFKTGHKITKYRKWLIIGELTFITLIPLCLYLFSFLLSKSQAVVMFESIVNQGTDTLSVSYVLTFCYQVTFLLIIAFAEEFIFRHTIYRHLRRYNFLFALFVSSFLFYIVHGQLFHLGFFFGIVSGVYYEYTNDFKGIVLTHALSNLSISLSWFYLAHLFLFLAR